MLTYPHIDPVILNIAGPFKIRWYGVMYLIGFFVGWLLALYRAKKSQGKWTPEKIGDLLFFIIIGVILGGRIGYMLFYDLFNFIYHPWIIFKIWDGGMSFHGGLLGVLVMTWWWGKRNKKAFLAITDFIAPFVPIGLGAGRLGNFINGELWGRVTTMPWGMVYPKAGPLPRHPSEIYEFLLEGVLLFIILWFYSMKPRPRAAVSGLFLLSYGCARCFCEFFRKPDPQLGYLAFGWLTMGQVLSIPMIILGIGLLWWAYSNTELKAKK